jgi:hypothetical protein
MGTALQHSPVREAWAECLHRELRRRPRGIPLGSMMLYLRGSVWRRHLAERAADDLVRSGRARLEIRRGEPVLLANDGCHH